MMRESINEQIRDEGQRERRFWIVLITAKHVEFV